MESTKQTKTTWNVILEDGYVKCYHSRRGKLPYDRLVCAGVLKAGKVTDVSFLDDKDRKNNMMRMPAMVALQKWEANHAKLEGSSEFWITI